MNEAISYWVAVETGGDNIKSVELPLHGFSKLTSHHVSRYIENEFGEFLFKYFGNNEYDRSNISTPEKIENLIDGTINLADKIIESSKNGNPIDFLVFMDKSARNGAYMLRVLWSELDKRGEIPNGVVLPECRFINIGRYDDGKHASEAALALLRLKYKNIFKDKKLLLVDEYTQSGDSLKLGEKTLKSVFSPKEISGFQQFHLLPGWFFDDRFKTVADVGDRDSWHVDGNFERVASILDNLKQQRVIEFYSRIYGLSENEFYRALKVVGWKNLNIRSDFKSLGVSLKYKKIVWNYFHTAGGFTAIPFTDDESTELSREYRHVLKEIMVKAMEYRDKEK